MSGPIPDAVLEAIRRGRRSLTVLHESPDGDSLGTAFGLALGLGSLGKKVIVAGGDPLPPAYGFLPGATSLVGPDQAVGPFDTAILPDCAAIDRTGTLRSLIETCPVVVNIDHHGTNHGFGTVAWVEPAASAAGELAYELLVALGAPITADVATCLYTAIVTDTGSFHYDSTGPRCLEICADLIRAGADPADLATKLYETRTESSVRLLARALGTLQMSPRRRLAWVTLTPADFAAAGAPDSESDGIVNFPRQIEGVEVAAFFKVIDEVRVRVGFRSRGSVDVAALAARFGGGGHAKASGCLVRGSLGTVREVVIKAAMEAVGE